MLPEEMPPPGLAEMLSGGSPEMGTEEPDTIDVDPNQGEESDEDLVKTAIEALQKAMNNESDDADSAVLAKVIQDLYKLTAGQQDQAIQAMGGQPKQMRGLAKAYGPA